MDRSRRPKAGFICDSGSQSETGFKSRSPDQDSVLTPETTPEAEPVFIKAAVQNQLKRKAWKDEDSEFEEDQSLPKTSKVTSVSNSLKKIRAAKKPKQGLYNDNVQQGFQEPYGSPEVWALTRQGLCNALICYNHMQAGAYSHGGVVKGLLLAAEVGVRDQFTDEIVITTSGGGRIPDENGKQSLSADQADNNGIASRFRDTMEKNLAVAVIASQNNPICPTHLPHFYCLLDNFHITKVWPDKRNGLKQWVVRLEKIDLSKKSWWAPKNSPVIAQVANPIILPSRTCGVCHVQHDIIYNLGWTCMTASCTEWFKSFGDFTDVDLAYTKEFLAQRSPYRGGVPGPWAHPLPQADQMQNMGLVGYEKIFWRGIHCPTCGCCSRRIEWGRWSCENPECDFSHQITIPPVRITDVLKKITSRDLSAGPMKGSLVKHVTTVQGEYTCDTMYFADSKGKNIGHICHYKANQHIRSRKDGPDDLFKEMQEDKFGLKRRPVKNASKQGEDSPKEILTRHWVANWGAPYKFIVAAESKSFSEAPETILKAVKRLTWAGEHAVQKHTEPFQPFNELLSLGYFEDSHISFHDDGEKQLGPTVATLSLGCAAKMSFQRKSDKKIVLNVMLEHGDIMVMHGTKIQQLYKHAVIPDGKLRFALTCRYIDPALLPEAERAASIIAGTLPAEFKYEYDGDAIISTGDDESLTDESISPAVATTPVELPPPQNSPIIAAPQVDFAFESLLSQTEFNFNKGVDLDMGNLGVPLVSSPPNLSNNVTQQVGNTGPPTASQFANYNSGHTAFVANGELPPSQPSHQIRYHQNVDDNDLGHYLDQLSPENRRALDQTYHYIRSQTDQGHFTKEQLVVYIFNQLP